jgi:hypothetical protein
MMELSIYWMESNIKLVYYLIQELLTFSFLVIFLFP